MSARHLWFGLMTASAALVLVATTPVAGDGAKVLGLFEMPAFSLTNFGYSQAELNEAATHALIDAEKPAIGSGLVRLSGDTYLGITDRGPNIDHFPVVAPCPPAPTSGSADGKTFPLPQFTPAVVRFQALDGVITVTDIVNLVTPLGNRITGLTNDSDDDNAFPDPCATTALGFNQNGMDVEDLALLPGGRMIGVEENKPSLFIATLPAGVVTRRYTPLGKALSGAEYPVSEILPAVLRQRRLNRGFEGVAVTPDGKTAYTATQSPLGTTNATRVIRILRLDVSNPDNATVTGEFAWIMSPASVYPQTSGGAPLSTRQQDLKLSAMAWVATDKLLLLERSDRAGAGGVRLMLADLTVATDILGDYDGTSAAPASGLTLEGFNTNLAANGITPAATTVVFEEYEYPAVGQFFSTYKLEGLAILNANQVAIINDNDFGIDPANPHGPTRLWKLRLADQLALGK